MCIEHTVLCYSPPKKTFSDTEKKLPQIPDASIFTYLRKRKQMYVLMIPRTCMCSSETAFVDWNVQNWKIRNSPCPKIQIISLETNFENTVSVSMSICVRWQLPFTFQLDWDWVVWVFFTAHNSLKIAKGLYSLISVFRAD